MTKELTVSMRHCQGKKWGIDRRKPDSDACGWPLTVLALTALALAALTLGGLRKPKWTSHQNINSLVQTWRILIRLQALFRLITESGKAMVVRC